MIDRVKNVSGTQFAIFRIAFGAYLAIHFFHLLPFSAELFSENGALPNPEVNFTYGYFPNPLDHITSPIFATCFVGFLAIAALFFTAGVYRRVASIFLWFGWACLFSRNNLISNPGVPYVGLLLVICALVPAGEPFTLNRKEAKKLWQMPGMLFWCAWILMAVGYSYSGYWKILSPSWQDGSAMHHVLTNPLARDWWFTGILLKMPTWSLAALSWFALAGELLALPMLIWKKTRFISWCWMVSMHLGILFVIDFADLTFGMLMIHWFTFDPDWLNKSRSNISIITNKSFRRPVVSL